VSRFVLDNTVTMAWCFTDEATPFTEALLSRLSSLTDSAIVPALWLYEVVNVTLPEVPPSNSQLPDHPGNGTGGGVGQKNLGPLDPNSGTGGATITSINGVQFPPVVSASQIATTASGLAYSRVSQTFNGTVTLRNTSPNAISGPLEIVFFGMPAGVTLTSATNILSGTPYLTVPD